METFTFHCLSTSFMGFYSFFIKNKQNHKVFETSFFALFDFVQHTEKSLLCIMTISTILCYTVTHCTITLGCLYLQYVTINCCF